MNQNKKIIPFCMLENKHFVLFNDSCYFNSLPLSCHSFGSENIIPLASSCSLISMMRRASVYFPGRSFMINDLATKQMLWNKAAAQSHTCVQIFLAVR